MDSRAVIVDDAYPIVYASDLCQILGNERIIFMSLSILMFMCALSGNIGSLYVNSRRKLRPFFRACLISLALSDIIYCISFTTGIMGYFHAKYLEFWTLGSFMCNFLPFITTTTVLSSSLMLAAIAMDRYMGIRKAATGIWNPSLLFCISCIGGIWLICLGSAVPLFFIYKEYTVYVVDEDELILATMCMGRRTHIGIYNIICISLVFIPCIVAFVFLNVIIALQLWQRRHQQRNLQQQQQDQKNNARFVHLLSKPETAYSMITAFSVADLFEHMSTAVALKPPSKLPKKLSPAAAARLARHRRMVRVVLLMIGTFMCLRLPASIFMLMRVYGNFPTSVAWLCYFSFGILNLTSCALNQLFYTYLTQTINVFSLLKRKLFCKRKSKQEPNVELPKHKCKQYRRYLCFGLEVKCDLKSEQATSPVDVAPSIVASRLAPLSDIKDDIFTIYTKKLLQSKTSIDSSTFPLSNSSC